MHQIQFSWTNAALRNYGSCGGLRRLKLTQETFIGNTVIIRSMNAMTTASEHVIESEWYYKLLRSSDFN
jgi:hypothetical protein